MVTTAQRGPGMVTPATFPVYNPMPPVGGTNYPNAAAGPITLPAGGQWRIPAGQFFVQSGDNTFLQQKDPITGLWRGMSQTPSDTAVVSSDGQNYRLINLTGCAVGAVMTAVGSAYTSAPAVAASAGGSLWTAIVGGAINATVVVTTAGVGYVYPPRLLISAPPAGGVQATAVAVVTGNAITGVTVINQGAGYAVAPTIAIVPDPRDTPTTLAVLTVNATLAGAGAITALLCTNHGLPQTATPTLAFTGGGGSAAAATVVMCFALTGYTVANAGAIYGASQPVLTITSGGTVTAVPGAVVNPALGTDIFLPRRGEISSTSSAGGAVVVGGIVVDPGLFQAVPGTVTLAGNSVPTTQAVVTPTVGGINDQSLIWPT